MTECQLYNNVLPHSFAGDFGGYIPAASNMAADTIIFNDLESLMKNEDFANAVNNAVYGLGISGVVYNGDKKALVYDMSIAGLRAKKQKHYEVVEKCPEQEIQAAPETHEENICNAMKEFASSMHGLEFLDISFAEPPLLTPANMVFLPLQVA